LVLTGAREPELKTLRQLQAKLPSAYAPERLAHFERPAFAGTTRATVRLEILVRAGNPLNERFPTSEATG